MFNYNNYHDNQRLLKSMLFLFNIFAEKAFALYKVVYHAVVHSVNFTHNGELRLNNRIIYFNL